MYYEKVEWDGKGIFVSTIKQLVNFIKEDFDKIKDKKEYGVEKFTGDWYKVVVDHKIIAIVKCDKPTFMKRVQKIL